MYNTMHHGYTVYFCLKDFIILFKHHTMNLREVYSDEGYHIEVVENLITIAYLFILLQDYYYKIIRKK